jgi:hypothetical protein
MATRRLNDPRRRAHALVMLAGTAAVFFVPSVATAQLGRATTAERIEAAPQTGMTETELSKSHQNATGDLVSVPVPFTFDLGEGVAGRTRYTASINPFIPVNLTEDVRLISRAVIPITSAPIGAADRTAGLGDTQAMFLLAPNRDRPLNYAVGPSVILPTATSSDIGGQKWAIGPAVAISGSRGPVTYGGVASYHWSVAGAERRKDVSLLTLQPYAFYNFGGGWAVGTTPTITANFSESATNMLTLPLGGGLYKAIKPDTNAALSLSVQAYANAIRPDNAPDAQVRFVVAGLFPQ